MAATHRAVWVMGDYVPVVEEVMAPLGPALAGATGIDPGDRVLHVAAGFGNISIPAVMIDATAVSSDLTPGVPPAALWGREDYVGGLLGETPPMSIAGADVAREPPFDSAEAGHQYFKNDYDSTTDAYRQIGENPVLAATLDNQLVELARRHLTGDDLAVHSKPTTER